MTNEEVSTVLHCPDAYGGIYGQKYGEALAHCFKLLEQADNLDKIKAEIEQSAYPIVYGFNNHEKGMTLYGILRIIDKYKAEREVRDDI